MLSFDTQVKIHQLINQQTAVSYAIDQMQIPTTTNDKLEVVLILLGEAAKAHAETMRTVLDELNAEEPPTRRFRKK